VAGGKDTTRRRRQGANSVFFSKLALLRSGFASSGTLFCFNNRPPEHARLQSLWVTYWVMVFSESNVFRKFSSADGIMKVMIFHFHVEIAFLTIFDAQFFSDGKISLCILCKSDFCFFKTTPKFRRLCFLLWTLYRLQEKWRSHALNVCKKYLIPKLTFLSRNDQNLFFSTLVC
jgi:hypothetical protein